MNNESRSRRVPFIAVDLAELTEQKLFISSSSSEESLPVDAPLVRQQRSSVDIDTVPTVLSNDAAVNGIAKHTNAYLDCSELRESTKDIV